MPDFDLAVVGAGAVGAAAALHAARAGKRVVLFEQFGVGHARGSSHGESRIIRHSYTSADYASLAPAAFQAWRELEWASGERLLTMTGGLDIGPGDDPALAACREALEAAGVGAVWLEGDATREAFPQFVPGDGHAALWQSGAGILNAGRCVATMVSEARRAGADVREMTRVTGIEPGREVAIACEGPGGGGRVTAGAAVIAAGPWMGRFFGALGIANELRVTHQQVVYYPVSEAGPWQLGRCPVYIAHGRGGFYGFPVCERAGHIKVAVETEVEIADPDEPPCEPDPESLSRLNHLVATRLRGVVPTPAEVVTCRYTEAANNDFIIDRVPGFPNVVVASPCSGHGFKFSILTGELAQALATRDAPAEMFANWRARFALDAARAAETHTSEERAS